MSCGHDDTWSLIGNSVNDRLSGTAGGDGGHYDTWSLIGNSVNDRYEWNERW